MRKELLAFGMSLAVLAGCEKLPEHESFMPADPEDIDPRLQQVVSVALDSFIGDHGDICPDSKFLDIRYGVESSPEGTLERDVLGWSPVGETVITINPRLAEFDDYAKSVTVWHEAVHACEGEYRDLEEPIVIENIGITLIGFEGFRIYGVLTDTGQEVVFSDAAEGFATWFSDVDNDFLNSPDYEAWAAVWDDVSRDGGLSSEDLLKYSHDSDLLGVIARLNDIDSGQVDASDVFDLIARFLLARPDAG